MGDGLGVDEWWLHMGSGTVASAAVEELIFLKLGQCHCLW